jgi:hypothetical protein
MAGVGRVAVLDADGGAELAGRSLMQAREQPIFSIKAGQTRAFHFHQLFAPTTYPIQISGCRNTSQQSVLHLVLEIARLYQGSWSATFNKKPDRHPDQSKLVAKISRGDVDSLPKPRRTWTEAILAKTCFYGDSKLRLMHSTYIQSFVPLIEPSEKTVDHLITCILLSSKGTA